MNLEIKTSEHELARAQLFMLKPHGPHLLVATKRLALSHEAALTLVGGFSYSQLFKHAQLFADAEGGRRFTVLHGGFTLFRNGEPDIIDFAAICPAEGEPAPHLVEAITLSAEMLG